MKSKTNTAQELSRIFHEFSYLFEMQGIAFKPRAYQLASESIDVLGDEVEDAWRKGGIKSLKELPGIGQSIAEKIDEFIKTGKILEYERMKKQFPVDIWELSHIEGLGPKHIADLFKFLKVKNLKDLKEALSKHKVRTIPRWGEKSEEKLAKRLELMESASGRWLLGNILPLADDIVASLSKIKGVNHCVYAGSLRRRQETIGDIDLIATTNDPERVMDAFISLPMVQTVHERGKTRSSVRLKIGIDADLRVVPDNVYGATLQYFTGDKRHNVLLREFALSKRFTLSEYGLFHLSSSRKKSESGPRSGKLIVCKTEEEIYKKLGMDTPPPELRVGADEIDAARGHRLPNLLPYGSVKGDLQVQTDWTDGSASIEDMVKAAKSYGLSYLAITDHTKAMAFINGLDDKRILKQIQTIRILNKKLKDFRVLAGTECDIHKDGTLDLKDETLAKLDWVGISIHSSFNLSRDEQTRRLVKAISNKYVDCVFHPTCRLIGKREPIDFNLDEVLAAAKKYNVAMEIDAFPERSDLRDLHVRAAIKAGVKLAIDTDAHAPEHLRFIPLGEAIARRGWATKKDVLNTKNYKELMVFLNKKRTRG
ncbi:MAG: DNA polymerase/3'-5' exonuclease PolX [Patescibacteria group bacterium]